MPCIPQEGWRVKMVILTLSFVGLLLILYPVIIGSEVVDRSEVVKIKKAVINTTVYERLEDAFSNRPFAIAMTMIGLTVTVIIVASVVMFNSCSRS